MNEKKRDEMAYFRYSVIVPLLESSDRRTVKRKLKEQAARFWPLPDGRVRQFAWGTIEKWLYNYKRHGLSGLKGIPRRDAGAFRGMPVRVSEELDKLLAERPELKPSFITENSEFQGAAERRGRSEPEYSLPLHQKQKAADRAEKHEGTAFF